MLCVKNLPPLNKWIIMGKKIQKACLKTGVNSAQIESTCVSVNTVPGKCNFDVEMNYQNHFTKDKWHK